ncbi:MAG TPA: lysozyme inhibitor LprI family protein [Chitinolyticbacter sp.]|nr:lysozyme inhibitor LprI family protein [Chitinolyticbacter sp.]
MNKFALTLPVALLGAALFAGHAQAAGCGKPRNAFDTVYCAGNLFTQTDKTLNQTYTELRKQLNSAQQSTLKQSQLAWIKQRDAQCSREDSTGYFVNLDCANSMTQERLDFLKERQRECSSTGCEASKLAQ